jgi:type I restriction enzyme S subunit
MSDLPAGWAWTTLNDLQAPEKGAITDGPFGSNLTSSHYTAAGARVIRLQNIGDGRFVDARAFVSMDHFRSLQKHAVIKDDLLVASLGERLPRACLAPDLLGPAIVKADCIRVRLSSSVDPRWVLYVLQTPRLRRWTEDQVHGVGRPRLGLKVIRSLPIPLPPLDEQRRIVDLLESHLSHLDAARCSIQAGRARRLPLRLAALNSWHRDCLEETAGVETPLHAVASTALGKMLDAKASSGVPTRYLRNINIRWGQIDTSDVRSVPLKPPEIAKFSLMRGDLLVCEGGEPGRAAIWPLDEAMTYQKALHRVRVKPGVELDTRFLLLMLEATVRSGSADHLFTGTTIKHLPQEKLRTIRFPLPSIATQLRFVAASHELSAASQDIDEALALVQRRENALRLEILRSAFEGATVSGKREFIDV